MPTLYIRREASGNRWRVWPEAEPAWPGTIQEAGSYLFELDECPEASEADLLIDDQLLEALRSRSPGTARWRWAPGFHAGSVEVQLRIPGGAPRRFEVITDPDERKLTRSSFDVMVREILEDSFALFSLSSFRRSVSRGSGTRPPAIARLQFLRSRIEELSDIVSEIARRPRHLLSSGETALPYFRASRASGPEILKSFRSGQIRSEHSGSSRLPEALKGFLPAHIRTRLRRSSLDLPEHRQMKACLRAWSGWLSAVADTIPRNSRGMEGEAGRELSTWAIRCRRLSQTITRMASQAPFAEAGDAPPRLILSALFRNDPVYRRFFRLAQDMNLGIAAVFGNFLDMPLARTFELYELWSFLRLVRAATETFGAEGLDTGGLFQSDAAGGLTIRSSAVTVPVGGGWTLCFQKRYREFWLEPDGRGSYSREMTPDVVAVRETQAPEPARVIILDAKYRIGEGLNDALNSIHTYRDALVRESESGAIQGIVSAAYLLTPDLPGGSGTGYRETPLPGRLFHPEYRTSFRFGAVTIKPGMSLQELCTALETIIIDAAGKAQ